MVNEWNAISFIFRSKKRSTILNELHKGPKTPKLLEISTGIRINHVSNVLKELLDKNFIDCLNPEEKKGRFYNITELGNEILEKLKKMERNNK